MAETSIQWAHYTFNPWRGCSKVSPGCAHCYAETHFSVKLQGIKWGPYGKRAIAGESSWRNPLCWNGAAKQAGERRRVFCASLADVLEDRPELDRPLTRLLCLTWQTPHLDWLFLTKRPQYLEERLEKAAATLYGHDPLRAFIESWLDGWPPPNIWLGVSVEDQKRADERIPHLIQLPAALRFLSCEPLLEEIDVGWCLGYFEGQDADGRDCFGRGIDWVIVGGESGHKARRCNLPWVRSLVTQCKDAEVPVFVKQLGSNSYFDRAGELVESLLDDSKGGDPSEWPDELCVREFP
jgi:protein gp37